MAYYSNYVIRNVQNKKQGTERFEITQFHLNTELCEGTLFSHDFFVAVVIYSSFLLISGCLFCHEAHADV
jgi:hypothetical protein